MNGLEFHNENGEIRHSKDATFERMPLVSIILPVYNSVDYVGDAIQSILDQDYKRLELVIVDDESNDGSGSICEEYALRDNRIRYIRQQNAGVCASRNRGIEEARGEYIAFCDHDDLWLRGLLSSNLELLTSMNADFIKFGRRSYMFGKIVKETRFSRTNPYALTPEVLLNEYPFIVSQKLNLYIWDGIYSSRFIKRNGIRFDESLRYGEEDRRFNCDCLAVFTRMVINPKCYYEHYTRESSTSASGNTQLVHDIVESADYEFRILRDRFGNEACKLIFQSLIVQYTRTLATKLALTPTAVMPTSEKIDILQSFLQLHAVDFSETTYITSRMDKVVAGIIRDGAGRGDCRLLLLLARLNRSRVKAIPGKRGH